MNVKVLYTLVSAKHMEGITISIILEIKYGDHDGEYLGLSNILSRASQGKYEV